MNERQRQLYDWCKERIALDGEILELLTNDKMRTFEGDEAGRRDTTQSWIDRYTANIQKLKDIMAALERGDV